MAFLLQDTLQQTSFKGAKFYFNSITETHGLRTVVHDYVNKEDSIETLGLPWPTYNIDAVVFGNNYFDDKKALQTALNDNSSGIFIHPVKGGIECVAQSWTSVEARDDIGRATYSLQLKEVKPTIYPLPSTNLISKIADLYKKAYEKIANFLNNNYIITTAENILAAGEAIQRLTLQLRASVGAIEGVAVESVETAKSILETTGKNVYRIAAGENTGDAVAQSISVTDTLVTDGQTRYDTSKNLFGFGTDNVYLNIQNPPLLERINNDKFINGAVNGLLLVNMYDSAKLINYTNDEQIDATENDLNNKYDQILDEDNISISDEIFDTLSEIKAIMKQFFDQERLNTNKVITINTNDIPLNVLTYKYYGSTDNYDDLLTLNNIYNPSSISGTVKVFEQP